MAEEITGANVAPEAAFRLKAPNITALICYYCKNKRKKASRNCNNTNKKDNKTRINGKVITRSAHHRERISRKKITKIIKGGIERREQIISPRV